MFPEGLLESVIGGVSKYLSLRKVLIFVFALILFSPEKSAIFSMRIFELDVSGASAAFQQFFGKVKIYQYLYFVVVVFFISPHISVRVFKSIFVAVCNASRNEFLRREEVVMDKMEGQGLDPGEDLMFEKSRRKALSEINNNAILYCDINSLLSIVLLFLLVFWGGGEFVIFISIIGFVVMAWGVGFLIARKSVKIYLDEIWPLIVIKRECEHIESITNLKK